MKKMFFTYIAAFVGFTDTTYSVAEAGTVEIGVELTGNLSFPIDITVNVNFATATCKSKSWFMCECIVLLLLHPLPQLNWTILVCQLI